MAQEAVITPVTPGLVVPLQRIKVTRAEVVMARVIRTTTLAEVVVVRGRLERMLSSVGLVPVMAGMAHLAT